MKLKEKLNQAAGFTLVELIVVIAILAILAGIAVPAYSGYITQANKSADRQLVNDIKNALQLHFYSGNVADNVIVVGIDGEGIKIGDGDNFADAALTAAGINRNNGLKWDGWTGGATNQALLNHFNTASGALADVYNGNKVPTFVNEIEGLFDMVESVSTNIGGGAEGGAELVKDAASVTTDTTKFTADEFAAAWRNGTWDSDLFMGAGNSGDYNATLDKETTDAAVMKLAIANAAVIKARNTVVGGLVRNSLASNTYSTPLTETELNNLYNVFCNYNYGTSSIPKDAATVLTGGEIDNDFDTAIEAALNNNQEAIDDAKSIAWAYFNHPSLEQQAMDDAYAYYAMMNTVGNVNASSPDTYWDEMSDAVDLYASIVRKEVTLDNLTSAYTDVTSKMEANGIIVMATIKNGEITITTNPSNVIE